MVSSQEVSTMALAISFISLRDLSGSWCHRFSNVVNWPDPTHYDKLRSGGDF
jgi:hypothetical protein